MNVFVYGTLLDDVLRVRLLGRDVECVPAQLSGYAVFEQVTVPLPALQKTNGSVAQGLILTDLFETEIARLDAYELSFDYNAVELNVQVDQDVISARVYLPDSSVGVSKTLWSLARWQTQMADLSREMATEIGSFDPPLTGAQLHAQWHMIGTRASARLRARMQDAPTATRYAATDQDFAIQSPPTLIGNFFRLAQCQITHKTFAGQSSDVLPREVLIGADAALVLPYDPQTDHVLLVEQLRMGPLMRGAANPWSLEPVAGMVDAGETPENAGLRESQEEAGLTGITLEKMFGCYSSPGNATDYFYCYAGICDLPDPTTYTGGLEDESEDLCLHILPFADALALIETGEVNVGPLITMLYWLDRNRDRLRAAA